MYRADRIVGALLVVLGGGAWALTMRFPESGGLVGPASLPRLVASLLMAKGALLAWKAQRAVRGGTARAVIWQPGFRARLAAALGSIAVFIALLQNVPALGFPLLAPPLMIVLGWIFGARNGWAIVLLSLAVCEGAYLFFHGWLGLMLPPSAWF